MRRVFEFKTITKKTSLKHLVLRRFRIENSTYNLMCRFIEVPSEFLSSITYIPSATSGK